MDATPSQLSLSPKTNLNIVDKYRVVKDVPNVTKGIAAPWFKQPGGRTQYVLDKPIKDLIVKGFIDEI